MTSEVVPKMNPLRVKQWEVCRKRMLEKLKGMAEFQAKTILEMIPDIRIIKQNELWRIGGYGSFNAFCNQGLGVSRQHVYKLLSVNQDARNVLEIRDGASNQLTVGILDGNTLEAQSSTPTQPPEKPTEKALNKPPEPKKGRKKMTEPIDATFTEQPPAPAQDLPPAATSTARVCPHCGKEIQ